MVGMYSVLSFWLSWISLSVAWAIPEFRLAPTSAEFDYAAKNRACMPYMQGMTMCFLAFDAQKQSATYVLNSNLQEWNLKLLSVLQLVETPSLEYVNTKRYTVQQIDGVKEVYYASHMHDGWDGAGWLHPLELQQIVGGEVLVAQPQDDLFMFWAKTSVGLHQVLVSGVKRVYESSATPVSPYVYQWNGSAWVVWGEAVRKPEVAP